MDTLQETLRIGRVVELCNQIELYMTAIIEAYVSPRANKEQFLRGFVLNSSVVSFGSKIKLVLAINEQASVIKLDSEEIRKVGDLRNAFAHNDLISGIRMEDPTVQVPDPPVTVVIESIAANGRMRTITRDQAFADFMTAHAKAESCLKKMLETLRS
jgi:hypothetical protein